LLIETCTFCCHQINTLHSEQLGAFQKSKHNFPTKATALKVSGDHDVPEHGSVNPVATGSPKANKSFSSPEAHNDCAAGKHAPKIAKGALLCPEGVFVQKTLQFQHPSGGAKAGAQPEQSQPGGTGGMTDQTDPHGDIQRKNAFCRLRGRFLLD